MARSIHRTRRELAELERLDFSNREQLAKDLAQLKTELQKKRRIKRQVRSLRQSGNAPAPASLESLRIQEFDRSPYVHFPADADDVRGVLRALPSGVLDELEGVELRAGAERQREWLAEEERANAVPDPLTGRMGLELMPGVFTPVVLGGYMPRCNLISLFAYVYRPEIPNREIVEVYLRLQMLSTLVHEVAHHYDFTFRIERGRWRGDNREKCEIYAEHVQHDWVSQYVVPYLEAAQATEIANLQRWLLKHVGTTVPLPLLAGDPRSTTKDGRVNIPALFSTCRAFEELVTMVAEEQPAHALRVEFARQLHYAEEYDVPKRILQSVLDEDAKNVDAITLTADIAEHEEQHPLALELARRALAIERDHFDALRVLARVYERTAEWKRLLQIADRMLDLCGQDRWDVDWGQRYRALALLNLGRFDDAQAAIDAVGSTGLRSAERWADRMQRLLDKRKAGDDSQPRGRAH